MWIKDIWKNWLNNRIQVSMDDANVASFLGIETSQATAINEATYYTCLKLLSETMGKIPVHYYRKTKRGTIRADPTDATYLLETRPNDYMTPTTFWTLVEYDCQQKGNSFVWIDRGLGTKSDGSYGVLYRGIYRMDPTCVKIWMDDAGIFGTSGKLYYQYNDPKTSKEYLFPSRDVMHFKTWYSKDGITGEPVRKILEDTINGATQSQKVMNNLYKNGLTASMAMQYTADLDEQRIKKLQEKFADRLTGPQAAGKVIPIPAGLQLTPLTTKLTDAQFFDLKKYSALQIAAAFGIKPNQINNYDHSSYSNSEMQQLDFLVNTMSYRLKSYEEEINAKMLLPAETKAGFFYRFNEKALLRTDSKTQMETLQMGVNNAIYTPNEAREYLSLPSIEGGDILMCNGNYIPVTAVKEKGGRDDGKD